MINSNNDPWPGSRAIAIAKASTANDFSNSALALSTANLYGPTQPGGSLYGLNNSNPFNPVFQQQGASGGGFVPGGHYHLRRRCCALSGRPGHWRAWCQRRHILRGPCDRLSHARGRPP